MAVNPPVCTPQKGILLAMKRTVPASLDALEPVSLELRDALASCSRADIFASELLCREALANAALHGCRLDETRNVVFAAKLRADRLTMMITDEGPGFDWRSVSTHTPGDCDICGRGMAIYECYADRVRFNRSGNRLALVRRFGNRNTESIGLKTREKEA